MTVAMHSGLRDFFERCPGGRDHRRPDVIRNIMVDAAGAASSAQREAEKAKLEVCLAWALDWRWKSFAGRVGSNREPEATARRVCRRETPMTLAPRGRVGKKPEANRSTERK